MYLRSCVQDETLHSFKNQTLSCIREASLFKGSYNIWMTVKLLHYRFILIFAIDNSFTNNFLLKSLAIACIYVSMYQIAS